VQVTVEMDPGTFGRKDVDELLEMGMNRVSVGAQSFSDELLKTCGRSHSVFEIYEAVEHLRAAGVKNFSLDLMSGLPGQTMELFEHAVACITDINPAHVSSYDLTIEPRTKFGKLYAPGVAPMPSEDAAADMYTRGIELLGKAGYEHYETSNYAKRGLESVHNMTYWDNKPYFGFGMSAASFVDGNRFSRPRTMPEYSAWLADYEASGGAEPIEAQTPADALKDRLMLGLRLARGVRYDALRAQFGGVAVAAVLETVRGMVAEGVVADDENALRLEDPKGFLVQNTVLAELFVLAERLEKEGVLVR